MTAAVAAVPDPEEEIVDGEIVTDAELRAEALPGSYTAVEAARIVGVSEKRARQLADAGRLEKVPGTGPGTGAPLRITAASAHRERAARRNGQVEGGGAAAAAATGRARPPAEAGPEVIGAVRELVDTFVAANRRAIETAEQQARRTEEVLGEALAAERARAAQLEAQLAAAREDLAAAREDLAAARARRRIFGL